MGYFDDNKCFECGTETDVEWHHVVPKSRGGTKTIPLCDPCHMNAHGKDERGMSASRLAKEAHVRYKEGSGRGWGQGSKTAAWENSLKIRSANAAKFNKKIQIICTDLHYQGHYSIQSKAAKLNDMGIRTRRGCTFSRSSLRRILEYEIKTLDD